MMGHGPQPQRFLSTRSSIVYTFLLGVCVVCTAGGQASTEWSLHWSGEVNQGSSCFLEETDCVLGEEMASVESLWSSAPLWESAESLTLTPVFTGLVSSNTDIKGCSEDRWFPRLNITWHAAIQRDTTFIVNIRDCGKKSGQEEPPCEKQQCLKIKLKVSSEHKDESSQTIILSSTAPLTTYSHIYVRVRDLQELPAKTLEASISLPQNISNYHIYGMPPHFRELVPVIYRNISTLNLLHWTTPLKIWNSSCNREIKLQFQIMPENSFMEAYNIRLIKLTGVEPEQQEYYKPEPSDTVGNITFSNLTTGRYYFRLELNKDDCECNSFQTENCRLCYETERCIAVESGIIHMSDPGYCVRPTTPPGLDPRTTRALAISLGTGAAIFLALALLWVHRKFKTRPSESPQCKKRVLILYCKDNESHHDVVLKFANLLNIHGMCEVVLDEWDSNSIHKGSIYTWLIQQTDKADMIIVVGSEGAHSIITARKEGRFWPSLEKESLFGGVFPLAVKVLQENISSLSDDNILAVTFEYSQVIGLRQSLREIRSGRHSYRLTADLGKVLQYIHNGSDRYVEDNFKNQAIEMLSNKEGRALLNSISRAKEFHQQNTKWFTDRHGHSEPIPNEKGKVKDTKPEPYQTLAVAYHAQPTVNGAYLNNDPSTYTNCATHPLLDHS